MKLVDVPRRQLFLLGVEALLGQSTRDARVLVHPLLRWSSPDGRRSAPASTTCSSAFLNCVYRLAALAAAREPRLASCWLWPTG